MRIAMTLVLIACLSMAAAANPLPTWPAVSLTFSDSGVYEPELYPNPYVTNSVYLMVTCGLEDIYSSVSAISFAIGYDPGTITVLGYESLISDVVITGDWETGITLAATEPIMTTQVPVARMDFMWLGVPGYIRVDDHPQYPRQVITGQGNVELYCLVNHAGVGQQHLWIDDYCWFCEDAPGSPVEEISWGTIKALYHE